MVSANIGIILNFQTATNNFEKKVGRVKIAI